MPYGHEIILLEQLSWKIHAVIFLFPLFFILTYIFIAKLRFSYGAYLGVLWLIAIWMTTASSHEMREYFAKDEMYFSTTAFESIFTNRALWLLLNEFVGLFSNQPEDIIRHMRIMNLSFLIIIYLYAIHAIRTIPPLILAFIMSYFACVAALNLRDILVLYGTWMFLEKRALFGHSIRDQFATLKSARWPVALLFLLRPLQLTQLFLSGFKMIYLAGLMLVILAFLQTSFGTRHFYNYAYFYTNFEEVISEKANDKGFIGAKPTPTNIGFWTMRFVFAPTPASNAMRFVSDAGEYEYGRFDLGVRTISRFSLYSCYVAILYYLLRYPTITLKVLHHNNFILKFGLMFSLTYALFNFGASHERIKLTILILALLLVDRIRIALRKSKYQIDENHLSNSN